MTSSYTEVPVEIISGHYQSRSKMLTSQKCINMYIETQNTGRSPRAAMCWPGEKKVFDGANAVHSGITHYEFEGRKVVFIMSGILYQMGEDLTPVPLGLVPFTSDRVQMATDNYHIMWRTEGSIAFYKNNFILGGPGQTYIYDRDSLALDRLFDIRFRPNNLANYTLAVLESTIDQDSTNYLRPVFNDRRTINADAVGDGIRQIFVFQDKLYVGGERSIQIFYATGDAVTPLAPYDQAVSDKVGVASSHSMASSNTYLYFLGNDNSIYRMSGAQVENITPGSISAELRKADTSNAYGAMVPMEGQQFYILQIPESDLTMVYSETTGEFTRLQTGVQKSAHLMRSYIYAFNQHLITDRRNGNIYRWDFDAYESNGSTMLRQIDTMPITGSNVGVLGNQMIFGYMDIKLELGVGNNDFPNPQLNIEYSVDGGIGFKSTQPIPLQAEGQKFYRARWNDCFVFYDLVIRLKVTAGVFVAFHSASVALQPGGY